MKIKITCRPRYNPWLKKYLNTKTFSKILAFGILLNNVSINSFAGILSEDGRYETFEGSNITINNVLEEDKVDVEVEGNTLVNLCGEMNSIDTHWILKDGWWELSEEGVLFLDFKALVKPNTTYTVILNAKLNNSDGIVFGFRKDDSQWEGSYHSLGLNGINKFKFTTTNNEVNRFTIHRGTTIGETTTIGVKDILILEGDWTNKETPSYFEGMKSVGQDDENGHNIEISSKNKLINNLFNYNDLEIGTIYHHNGTNDNGFKDRWRSKSFIDIGDSKTITVKSDDKYIAQTLHFYDANKNFIECKVNLNNPKTEIIPDGTRYIRYVFRHSNEDGILPTLPLSGEQITITLDDDNIDYIDSQSNKIQISLNEPLRGLPNGIKDRIIKKNGQWYVERNIGELILDGSEEWIDSSTTEFSTINDSDYITFHNISLYGKYPVDSGFISNNFNYLRYDGGFKWRGDYEGISDGGGYNFIFIRINKSKLETPDVEGFKKWLNKNPTTIYYQLRKPTQEYLKITGDIQIFKDISYISTNSTIPANLKVTVDRVANRAKEYSELAKENPTIENISLARMWTNKMRESILKDEFQDNIDTITEITDMTLERKTASANLDVYIKSENMLSMNLSTNSITFDDFSGVEDMIKENAVNISINSSLPYNLNAYLATEIQNSDKSNTMNKDILSIKDNSELDYQTFSSTNDRVVLKSNCTSGNDKQHNINLKLNGGIAHKKDVYKTTIKFEAEQQ